MLCIIALGVLQGFAYARRPWIGGVATVFALAVSVLIGIYNNQNPLSWGITTLFPSFLLAFGSFFIFKYRKKYIIKGDRLTLPFKIELLTDKNKKLYIEDADKGIAIFGASGSGKSQSVIYSLTQHYAKYHFAGLINDYKDFELTEIAYPLFRNEKIIFNVFAISDPERSVRINPIAPRFIRTEADVNGRVSAFMINLAGAVATDDTSSFFNKAAESLLAGVIWRLKEDYPEYCNFPFIISMLLNPENLHEKGRPFGKLIDFLQKNYRAALLASTFLTGVGAEKQTAALFSTLSNFLRTLVTPEVFYLLSADEYDLALNSAENRSVLSFVNSPGQKEGIISPINAMIIEACFSEMSKRNCDPAFVLLDEAPTIKLMGLGRRVATLRSYGISFTYCMQDKIQGLAQWGGKDYMTKEVLTNLSTQFMGKVNDPDTARFYENYFEKIEVQQKSTSQKSGWGSGDKRITTSKKEQSKHRGYEFFRLQAGEFVMFSGGRDIKFRFKYFKNMEKAKPPVLRVITDEEMERHFNKIINDAHNLFNKKIVVL